MVCLSSMTGNVKIAGNSLCCCASPKATGLSGNHTFCLLGDSTNSDFRATGIKEKGLKLLWRSKHEKKALIFDLSMTIGQRCNA